MSTATKGRRLEHEVRKLFQDAGWDVIRGAASKGEFCGFKADLVATGGYDAVWAEYLFPDAGWVPTKDGYQRKTKKTIYKVIVKEFDINDPGGYHYMGAAIQCKVSKR
jgi:hypothetical protein